MSARLLSGALLLAALAAPASATPPDHVSSQKQPHWQMPVGRHTRPVIRYTRPPVVAPATPMAVPATPVVPAVPATAAKD